MIYARSVYQIQVTVKEKSNSYFLCCHGNKLSKALFLLKKFDSKEVIYGTQTYRISSFKRRPLINVALQ